MRLLLSLFMFLATVMTPTVQALPGSSVVCDVNRVSKHRVAGTSAARFQLSAASVAAGGSTSITIAGSHGGFLLYVTDAAGTHVGTFGGTLATASRSCTSGVPAGSTVSHTAATLLTSRTFMWTAPTTPGTYTVTALVAESAAGTPTLLTVPSATITVAAAQAQPTQAPTRPPTQPPTQPSSQTQTQAPAQTAKPATTTAPRVTPTTSAPVVIITPPGTDVTTPSTTPVDVTPAPSKAPGTGTGRTPATASPETKDAYNLVLVTLQDVLAGTATVAQLRTAIQNLMTQIQAAIQKAKAAQGAANANAKVKMIVTKAPATAAANSLNLAIGFADAGDAVVFAALVKDATDPAARSTSPLTTSGDLAAQVQANPNGLDTNTGDVTVTDAQQVATVTCSDGTVVSQDMQAVLCPNAAFSPAAGAGAGTTNAQAVPLSNGAFIGIVVTGIVLVMALVAGLMYYQKAKAKSTVAPRV